MYARTNRCYNERGYRTNYVVLAYPTVFIYSRYILTTSSEASEGQRAYKFYPQFICTFLSVPWLSFVRFANCLASIDSMFLISELGYLGKEVAMAYLTHPSKYLNKVRKITDTSAS
jgi:uncharacterized membrane protein YadS